MPLIVPSGGWIYTRTALCAQVTATVLPPASRARRAGGMAANAAALPPSRLEADVDTIAGVGLSARSGSRVSDCGRSATSSSTGRATTSAHSARRRSRGCAVRKRRPIAGVVRSATLRKARGRLTIIKAIVEDDSGGITATWFNQPWLESS